MKVTIITASKSDEEISQKVVDVFKENNIPHELQFASAHREPDKVRDIVKNSDADVFIAIAGLSAALPGFVASITDKPVIGLPVNAANSVSGGLDALLAISQMPPGVPVLAVGVNKPEVAAQNCAKMMKKYESITIIGDKNNEAVKKAIDTLKKFEVLYSFAEKPNSNNVNIEFTYFDEPVEKKDELVIYCPLLSKDDDKAEASLNFLKHTSHGLWVGINNGVNAAVAAIEIMNIDNSFEEPLTAYRREIGKKVLDANK